MASYPQRAWRHLRVLSGIPLLALALGTGDAEGKSIERDIGTGAAKKTTARATAVPDPRQTPPVDAHGAGARNHDPCCSDDPPVPRARTEAAKPDTRITPASGRASSPIRVGTEGNGAARPEKQARDSRIVPRRPAGEQRRGGAGALIGLTFA
jgi:hypothetical protein